MSQTELLTINQINFRNKNEKTRNNGSKLSYNLFKIEFKTNDSIPKVSKIHNMPSEPVVVPGSFKPVHEGHFLIGISACKEIYKRTNIKKPIIFELSKFNRNKPSISDDPVKARIKEFLTPKRPYLHTVKDKAPNFDSYTFYICITETAMFRDKIDIFGKGASFVIGADLFVRLISPPKAYSNGKPKNPIIACTEVLSDLIKFKDNKCKFYVANRLQANKNIANKKVINVNKLNNKNSVGDFNKIIKGQLGVFRNYIRGSSLYNIQTDAIEFLYENLITDDTLFKKIDDFVNINMSSTMVRGSTNYSNLNNLKISNGFTNGNGI